MVWERVYTINNYWDCPRLGVADVNACPHLFESPFDENIDDYADYFLVSPVDPELLSLLLEDRAIWLRWSEAFDNNTTPPGTHPALPEDRPRHEQLKLLIGNRLSVDTANSLKRRGEFRSTEKGWDGFEVRWHEYQGSSADSGNTRTT